MTKKLYRVEVGMAGAVYHVLARNISHAAQRASRAAKSHGYRDIGVVAVSLLPGYVVP